MGTKLLFPNLHENHFAFSSLALKETGDYFDGLSPSIKLILRRFSTLRRENYFIPWKLRYSFRVNQQDMICSKKARNIFLHFHFLCNLSAEKAIIERNNDCFKSAPVFWLYRRFNILNLTTQNFTSKTDCFNQTFNRSLCITQWLSSLTLLGLLLHARSCAVQGLKNIKKYQKNTYI